MMIVCCQARFLMSETESENDVHFDEYLDYNFSFYQQPANKFETVKEGNVIFDKRLLVKAVKCPECKDEVDLLRNIKTTVGLYSGYVFKCKSCNYQSGQFHSSTKRNKIEEINFRLNYN